MRFVIFLIFSFFLLLLTGCSYEESIQATGVLERDRVSLMSTASEIIIDAPVKEGQLVKKGQVIIQLDKTNQQAILAKAKAEQARAKANLTKILNGERAEDIDASKANLANAKAKLTDAKKHYNRMAELLDKRLISVSELDNAIAERDAVQATYNAAYQTWQKLSKGSRIEDIEAAQAQFAATQAEVKLQQHKLTELTIIATRDGILDSLIYNQGERVPQGAVVAIIQSHSNAYARVYIPEPYKHAIRAGVKLAVHIDGIDPPMQGKVRWISVEPAFTPYQNMTEADRARLVYLTEIDLPREANRLVAGIPLQVDLKEK